MVLLFVAWRFTETKTAHACSQSSKIGLFGRAGANNIARCTATTRVWVFFSFIPVLPVATGVNNYRRIVGTEVGGRVMSLKGG